MQPDEDFWDDLLGHMREQVLVPVVGPEMAMVSDADRSLPLSILIAERLAARYKLEVDWNAGAGLDAVVRAYFAARGHDQDERLYRVINDILGELNPQPAEGLKQLAAITDLNFFISTTFDNLLARAIDAVRFGGAPTTQQYWFSPTQSTEVQEQNARRPDVQQVVFKLFGEASSLPQYAIHEEDMLEWLHALLSGTAHLPDWVEHQLKERPLLLLGCQMPDWIGRFLIRLASSTRLSMVKKQFFIVGKDISRYPELSAFFRTYCGRTSVQVVEQDPVEFAAELHERWRKRQPATPVTAAAAVNTPATSAGSIFISYVREDAEAARRLADAITGIGGDVWLDQQRLQPGDRWESEILGSIRRGIRLFVPVISRQTESREEGYVFKEWAEAVERAKGIPGRRFIVPVVIDENYDGNPAGYRMTPEMFRQFHFGAAPAGQPNADLLAALTEEIRSMRRPVTP